MEGRPGVHIFEFLMQSLRKQTFKDFEVVIADVLFDERKTYFTHRPEKFSVKHVPVKPNIWIDKGYCAISTTKNTCLLHANNEVIVFTDDCSYLNERHLEIVANNLQPNKCISNTYDIYKGENLLFHDVRKETLNCGGAYGNVALYLEDYLQLNGYNEIFDGSRGLEDCELSLRMRTKGMVIDLLDYPVHYQYHNRGYPRQPDNPLRCPRVAEVLSYKPSRISVYRANTTPYDDEELKLFLECSNIVEGYRCKYVKDSTGTNVECKSGVLPDGTARYKNKELILKMYKHPSLIFDLREQRRNVTKALEDLDILCKSQF
jgi:hypothetical protein